MADPTNQRALLQLMGLLPADPSPNDPNVQPVDAGKSAPTVIGGANGLGSISPGQLAQLQGLTGGAGLDKTALAKSLVAPATGAQPSTAVPQADIEMPPMNVGRQQVNLGFPHAPTGQEQFGYPDPGQAPSAPLSSTPAALPPGTPGAGPVTPQTTQSPPAGANKALIDQNVQGAPDTGLIPDAIKGLTNPPPPPAPPPPMTPEQHSQQMVAEAAQKGMQSMPPIGPPGAATTAQEAADIMRVGLQTQLAGVALSGYIAADDARKAIPFKDAQAQEQFRIAQETQAKMQEQVALYTESMNKAQRAVQEAYDNHPDPSKLFGGSWWAQAIAGGIAASHAGVSGGGIAQYMETQLAGKQAEYDALLKKGEGYRANAEGIAKSMPGLSASFEAMQAASKYKLGAAMQQIAAQSAPTSATAAMWDAGGKLMVSGAKDTAEIGAKQAAVDKDEADAQKALYGKGGARAGGGGTGPGPGSTSDPWSHFGKERDEVLVLDNDLFNSSGGTKGYKMLGDKEERDKAVDTLATTQALVSHISRLEVMVANHSRTPADWSNYTRTPAGQALVSEFEGVEQEYAQVFKEKLSTRNSELIRSALGPGADQAAVANGLSALTTTRRGVQDRARNLLQLTDAQLNSAGTDASKVFKTYSASEDPGLSDSNRAKLKRGTAGTGGAQLSPEEMGREADEAARKTIDENKPTSPGGILPDSANGVLHDMAQVVNPNAKDPLSIAGNANRDEIARDRIADITARTKALADAKPKDRKSRAEELQTAKNQLKAVLINIGPVAIARYWNYTK